MSEKTRAIQAFTWAMPRWKIIEVLTGEKMMVVSEQTTLGELQRELLKLGVSNLTMSQQDGLIMIGQVGTACWGRGLTLVSALNDLLRQVASEAAYDALRHKRLVERGVLKP